MARSMPTKAPGLSHTHTLWGRTHHALVGGKCSYGELAAQKAAIVNHFSYMDTTYKVTLFSKVKNTISIHTIIDCNDDVFVLDAAEEQGMIYLTLQTKIQLIEAKRAVDEVSWSVGYIDRRMFRVSVYL
jgi:hypothetical protein